MKFLKRFWFPATATLLLAIVAINSAVLLQRQPAGDSPNGQADAGGHAAKSPTAADSHGADDPIAAERAKLGPEDRALVEAQEWCVVTDERLGSMGPPIKLTIAGQPVLLCCKGCQQKAEAEPEQTLKKLAELKTRAKSGHDHEALAAGEHNHGSMPGGRGMMGRGMMGGGMMGQGMMGGGMADMASMRADMQDIHLLLSNHESVERTVKQLPNGVETVNTSSDPAVVPMLQKHVRVMHKRLKEKRGIRLMDPLFVAVFEHADKIEMSISDLPDGVKVVETSQDEYVVRLIQEHARGVDRFVAEGLEAMHKTTPAPPRNEVAATAWSSVEETKLSDPQRDQQQRAVAARAAMFEQLSGRLKVVIGEKGAAAAISVCGTDAPEIARRVAREHGVAIGRTSLKLRNSKNTPPDWALPLIEAQPKQPMFAAHGDGRLAALLPILLKKECLACHGPRESLAADVRQALAKHYPDDQAIGFAEGDLRGWFWVEVPSLTTTQGK